MARLTYVPLHSIIVVRDDKQVDALAEYKRTGKAFKFEQSELDEIAMTYATAELPEGSLDQALRAPAEEGVVIDQAAEAPKIPATSSTAAKTPVVADTSKAAPSKDGDL